MWISRKRHSSSGFSHRWLLSHAGFSDWLSKDSEKNRVLEFLHVGTAAEVCNWVMAAKNGNPQCSLHCRTAFVKLLGTARYDESFKGNPIERWTQFHFCDRTFCTKMVGGSGKARSIMTIFRHERFHNHFGDIPMVQVTWSIEQRR